MNKGLQWTIGISVGLIALAIVAATVLPLFLPNAGWSGYGMMGPGHMFSGGPMIGGFGMPFFSIGMWLLPLLFVGVIALGIVWLVRAITPSGMPPATNAMCAHCGKPLQAGWKACPYCGEKV